MVKGSIQEEDITIIINIYAPNIGTPRYLQQILTGIKGEINGNTIIVGDFNNPLTTMDRSSKQKINRQQLLKDTIEKLDLIDIFRILHQKKNENIHSSQVHMEHSQELIIYWGTKLTSTNLRI